MFAEELVNAPEEAKDETSVVNAKIIVKCLSLISKGRDLVRALNKADFGRIHPSPSSTRHRNIFQNFDVVKYICCFCYLLIAYNPFSFSLSL